MRFRKDLAGFLWEIWVGVVDPNDQSLHGFHPSSGIGHLALQRRIS